MKAPAWRAEYTELYRAYKTKRFGPAWLEQFGRDPMVFHSEKKANGLTQLITRYLLYQGHYANRIGTQGQATKHAIPKYNLHSGKVEHFETIKWRKGNTKKGTPDITGIVFGWAVWIEVKIGSDRMSPDQQAQKADIEAAGGLYFIARDMQSFVDWYHEIFKVGDDPDLYTTTEGYD